MTHTNNPHTTALLLEIFLFLVRAACEQRSSFGPKHVTVAFLFAILWVIKHTTQILSSNKIILVVTITDLMVDALTEFLLFHGNVVNACYGMPLLLTLMHNLTVQSQSVELARWHCRLNAYSILSTQLWRLNIISCQ